MEKTDQSTTTTYTITQLAREFFEIKQEITAAERQLKELTEQRAQIEGRLLEAMQRDEIVRFAVDGVGLLFQQTTFYPKVIGDPDKAIQYLDEHGYSEVAPRSVNTTRLRELINERLEKDLEPLPPELFQTAPVTRVQLRKRA